MARSYRSVSEAVAFLQGAMARTPAGGSGRLMPVRRLAADGGFSPVTCRRALARLASQGLCTVVPGGGVFARPGVSSLPVTGQLPSAVGPRPQRRWAEVRERINADLLGGRYPPGDLLPLCKAFASRYGASHATVVAALESLVQAGRLSRERRRYRVYTPGRRASRSRVVLVAHEESLLNLIGFTPRVDEYLRHLERRCMQYDIDLELLSFRDAVLWTPRGRRVLVGEGGRAVAGCLVWALGFSDFDLQRLTNNLLGLRMRAALLDEVGKLSYPEALRTNPLFRVYTMAFSQAAGRDVGRFLLERGHRQVAYFADAGGEPCHVNRSAGLEAYLAGNGGGPLRRHWLVDGRDEYGGLIVPRRCAYRSMRRAADRFAACLADASANPHRMRFERDARVLTEQQVVRDRLTAAMEACLADEAVTAWVAGSDALAFTILGFLASRKVDVPRRLTVVGFDDAPGAFNAGLTTYNFNVPAVADAMLEQVLGGPRGPAGGRQQIVEIPGYVVERRTSGVVRTHIPSSG